MWKGLSGFRLHAAPWMKHWDVTCCFVILIDYEKVTDNVARAWGVNVVRICSKTAHEILCGICSNFFQAWNHTLNGRWRGAKGARRGYGSGRRRSVGTFVSKIEEKVLLRLLREKMRKARERVGERWMASKKLASITSSRARVPTHIRQTVGRKITEFCGSNLSTRLIRWLVYATSIVVVVVMYACIKMWPYDSWNDALSFRRTHRYVQP